MTGGRPQDRVAAARARLDEPRPEAFRFTQAGDTIAGTVVRLDSADTDYGPCRVVVVDPGDGGLRSIWLFHDALLSQMQKLRPMPGDVIAVRYLGRTRSAAGRSYHDYAVATDAARGQFEWDSPSARPPQPDRDEHHQAPAGGREANPFDDDPPF
jgi:hypothetical protein